MRDAFANELLNIMKEDSKVLLLTGDLGFGVFDQIRESHPNNFINIGVAEQNMTGVAAGLAIEGYKVYTYSIANFSTFRCLEQIRNDASYHDLNINVVSVGGGFSYGPLGMSHHATEDISIMRSMPGVTVSVPGTKKEAIGATRHLASSHGVGYLRLDKSDYINANESNQSFTFGKASTIKDGKDITLICSGGILEEAVEASSKLEKFNISCKILSMHTIKPLDTEVIRQAVNDTRGIITIEEHTILGGLGGAVSEFCMQNSLKPEIFKMIGLNDTFSKVVGDQKYLRKHYNMDSTFIADQVEALLKDV